jgi:sugar O-acyltransferase (sialic acid O-acetyltransferase NeuD family)
MGKKVIVIGIGGHGKVVADIVCASGDTLIGFLDDNPQAPREICGFPVLGTVEDYARFPEVSFVVGIGNASDRRRISEKMAGVNWYTAIHPNAVVSRMNTKIGEGTVIMAGAVVNPCTTIGNHCVINTSASVDHDCCLGDYSHAAVGASLAGVVSVGKNVWIGAGAVISNSVSVCDNCMIGAGAVIVRDIEAPGTYVGIPARKIR